MKKGQYRKEVNNIKIELGLKAGSVQKTPEVDTSISTILRLGEDTRVKKPSAAAIALRAVPEKDRYARTRAAVAHEADELSKMSAIEREAHAAEERVRVIRKYQRASAQNDELKIGYRAITKGAGSSDASGNRTHRRRRTEGEERKNAAKAKKERAKLRRRTMEPDLPLSPKARGIKKVAKSPQLAAKSPAYASRKSSAEMEIRSAVKGRKRERSAWQKRATGRRHTYDSPDSLESDDMFKMTRSERMGDEWLGRLSKNARQKNYMIKDKRSAQSEGSDVNYVENARSSFKRVSASLSSSKLRRKSKMQALQRELSELKRLER